MKVLSEIERNNELLDILLDVMNPEGEFEIVYARDEMGDPNDAIYITVKRKKSEAK